MFDMDLYNMFRERVNSSALPYNSWAYHLCLNCLLSCRLCPGKLALGEIRGKVPLYAISQGGDSSDDKTVPAGERVAQVLQSCFDVGRRILDLSAAYISRRGLGVLVNLVLYLIQNT